MSVQTTIGSYGHAHGWSAVVVLELDGEQLLVEERHARADDPDARGLVLRRYRAGERERALSEGAARVLALGGRLDCEPEQLAGSLVAGQARAELRPEPRNGGWASSTDATRGRSPPSRRGACSARSSSGTCTWSGPRWGNQPPQRKRQRPANGRADRPPGQPTARAAILA